MNKEQFYEEVMNSDICPERWDEIYEYFCTYQSLAIDTLKEFHRVCENNKISYQVAYGSLLGAIREQGQIPWDYDIDVFVPYEEKDRLVNALNQDLDKKYYYHSPEADEHCRHFIMRLAPVGYKTEVLHVDVFYVTGSPDDNKERKVFQKKIKRLSNIRYWKLINAKEECEGRKKRYIKMRCLSLMHSVFPVRWLNRTYTALCSKYPVGQAKFCVTADAFADWYSIPSIFILDTMLYKTSYGEIRIPRDYDKMLKLVYGDYHTKPNLENRLGEVIRHCNRFKRFEQYKALD